MPRSDRADVGSMPRRSRHVSRRPAPTQSARTAHRVAPASADHRIDLTTTHACDRQVMTGGEAHHPALPDRRVDAEEPVLSRMLRRRSRGVGQKCGEVVHEHERGVVRWIDRTTGAFIAGTQVAGRVVRRCDLGLDAGAAIPWPLRTLRRHHDPFARQRIATAMRVSVRVERHGRSVRHNRRMSGLNARGPRRGTATPTVESSRMIRCRCPVQGARWRHMISSPPRSASRRRASPVNA